MGEYVSVGGYVNMWVGWLEGGKVENGNEVHMCACAQYTNVSGFDELTKRALLKRASLIPHYFPCIASIPKPMPASKAHAGVQHVAMRLPE